MRLDLSPTAKNARSSALLPLLADGNVTIFGGTPPSAGGTATTALLVYALDSPAGTVTAGTLAATTPITGTGLADGVATWGRIEDSSGAWVIDGDAGGVGADAFFILDSVSVTTGASISLLALTLIEP